MVAGVGRLAAALAFLSLLATLVAAAPAAARDQIVISGSTVVGAGQTAGDVVVIDGPVTIAGRATGDVVAVHGRIRVSGRVDGDVVAVSRGVVLGPSARVGGDLQYGSSRPQIAPGAKVAGEVSKKNWDEVVGPAWSRTARFVVWVAVSVSSLILGLLLLWFAPRAARAVMAAGRDAPGVAIAWGIGLMIGLPLAALVALITLVGIPFGIGLMLALLPLFAIGYASAAWVLGRSLVKPPSAPALAFLAGWGILRVLALIPFAGGLVSFLATAAGLGALVVAAWRARGGGTRPAPAAQPVPTA
jgi:cytoskeletal protein CcmA (bactofilin family)